MFWGFWKNSFKTFCGNFFLIFDILIRKLSMLMQKSFVKKLLTASEWMLRGLWREVCYIMDTFNTEQYKNMESGLQTTTVEPRFSERKTSL